MRKARQFYDHQRKAFQYCMAVDHPALFMEMRLGKSLPCIRRCKLYKPVRRKLGLRVLVVAPTSTLGSWERECGLENVNLSWLTAVTGNTKKRSEELKRIMQPQGKPDRVFCLMNKEGWKWMPEIKDYNWDSVVVDESPILKNPKANITKYFLKHFRKVPHRWALTGTPNPEGDENYFCQLAWLDGSAFGHRSFWSFRPSYMEPPYIGYRWVFIPGAIDHIRREVGRRAFVLRRKDVGLDEYKIYERREFEMPKKLRKAYDEAEENFAFNYDGKAYKTMWKGAQYQWLRQMCGGVINKEMVWDGKLQGALELLQGENAHDQVIVWCNYNAEVFAIYAALKKAGIKCAMMTKDTKPPRRRQLERMFDKGLVRVLVLQQAIVQYGADLKAADTVYYYSTPLGHLARTQTEDRIVTIEKAKKGTPLLYIDFVVKDSVDEDALSLLDTKEVMSDLSLARALATAIRERKKWV